MIMKKNALYILIVLALVTGSCKKFLDVVPDNVPVIDQAFNLRVTAERYLVTCYSRLPSTTNLGGEPGYLGADEFWLNSTTNFASSGYPAWYIAMGQQNSNSPLVDYWRKDINGARSTYWQGINDCNVFIERIHSVPDMDEYEKLRWAAEAKFLKAYYHYLLVRAYGPIIILDKNIAVYSSPDESRLPRVSVDECFDYIVKTMDEAMPNLMPIEEAPGEQIGRITQLVAKSIKAKILVYAASPLFNGNTNMSALRGENGNPLFNQTYDVNKWTLAAKACKEAIDFAHANAKKLQVWTPPSDFVVKGPTTQYQMNLRQAISTDDVSENTEALWFDSNNVPGNVFQREFIPRGLVPGSGAYAETMKSNMGVTLNMAEKFYSDNGVPIEEDRTYDYASRYKLVTVPDNEKYKYDLQVGYETIKLHLDREPRFYGTVSFDGGRYLMYSQKGDANAFNTNYKPGTTYSVDYGSNDFVITGYMTKKYISPHNTFTSRTSYSVRSYLLPIMRLADLYLLYAEALNESQGPSQEVYTNIDAVRARSGLKGVVESWTNFSKQPSKPTTKEGLRSIIKRERTIELAFERERFWDLRRWKDAGLELNELILAWDKSQAATAAYYRPVVLFNSTFLSKDYFWPISLAELNRNSRLKQNVGW